MLFNSIAFLIFLPSVFIIYWSFTTNLKLQNLILLIASYIFYAWWDWRFLSLIIFSSIVDYCVGIQIYKTDNSKAKYYWLLVSLVMNLGLLGVFKYFNFFAESFQQAFNFIGYKMNPFTLNIILPVGISFYTFQTLSYSIDIYRGNLKPTRNVVSFFTFIAFFPQLVAGPIERASNLLPQIDKKRNFNKEWFKAGILQVTIGLFRKIVIADTLGRYVDTIYSNPEVYNSSTLLIATFFYAFQIYFDFSGYSDIAIGTAKMFGFKFMQNFDLPYFSKSLTEFWRRWHMSLSFWLRDYLYISLGGNRKGIKITYRNLLLTMLLGGLWHGSSWNFVIWGGIHGIVLSFEKFSNGRNHTFFGLRNKWIGRLTTFAIVLVSWIFFRALTLQDALNTINKIFYFQLKKPFIGDLSLIADSVFVLTLGILFDIYLYKKNINLEELGIKYSNLQVIFFISFLVILINLFYSTSETFIYFQF